MAITAYLAGPDVFLPDAASHARRKVEICARYGIIGRPPLDENTEGLGATSNDPVWWAIFRKNRAMMESCDIVIANLTPFRGPSADAGTVLEVGWFLGRGKPVFGCSNHVTPFAERSCRHVAANPDPLPGMAIDGFGLPDNLMLPGAVLEAGGCPIVLPPDHHNRSFDALDVFERCVELAATRTGCR